MVSRSLFSRWNLGPVPHQITSCSSTAEGKRQSLGNQISNHLGLYRRGQHLQFSLEANRQLVQTLQGEFSLILGEFQRERNTSDEF